MAAGSYSETRSIIEIIKNEETSVLHVLNFSWHWLFYKYDKYKGGKIKLVDFEKSEQQLLLCKYPSCLQE